MLTNSPHCIVSNLFGRNSARFADYQQEKLGPATQQIKTHTQKKIASLFVILLIPLQDLLGSDLQRLVHSSEFC